MGICEELRIRAEELYAAGIERSIEVAAACFRLCAEALSRFPEDGGGSYPMPDIALLVACSAVSGGWNRAGSADKERLAERLKLYVSSINRLCDDLPLELTVPGYASIGRNLMTPEQIAAFTAHLAAVLQTLDEHEKMAVVTMHDLMLYAVFEQWPPVNVPEEAYALVTRTPEAEGVFEGSTGEVHAPRAYAVPTQSSAAAITRYERNAARRWRPLKIYLIVTGLFIALVLALYFYAAPAFSEGQAVVVKDITGQTVRLLPDSEPVELAIVGLTDYNGVVRLFYGTIIGVAVYRLVTVVGVFLINAVYRRQNAQKAAALRAGASVP